MTHMGVKRQRQQECGCHSLNRAPRRCAFSHEPLEKIHKLGQDSRSRAIISGCRSMRRRTCRNIMGVSGAAFPVPDLERGFRALRQILHHRAFR